MNFTVQEFEEKFKKIYGISVWKDFFEYGRNPTQRKIGFESMEEIETQIEKYVENINNIKNFFENRKNFVRFILISIERAYRPESREVDFSKPYSKNSKNEKFWEVEHIVSRNSSKEVFNNIGTQAYPENDLSNLTLISRDLNGSEEYKIADFEGKKELIRKSPAGEYEFYINKIFRCESSSKNNLNSLLKKRKQKLIKDFRNIFRRNELRGFNQFYSEVLQHPNNN